MNNYLAKYIIFCIPLIFVVHVLGAKGQDSSDNRVFELSGVETEIGAAISEEGNLPFWLHSNQWGIIDRFSSNGYLRINPTITLNTGSSINVKAGADLIGRVSKQNTAFFNEAYVQADWHFLRFLAGRKKMTIGITDSSYTMGSMIQSSNASPIPKIQILTPQFVDIPGTKGWFSFKAYFVHGWMEKERFVNNALLHQKYLYFSALPDRYPIKLYGGISQNTLWAGTHPYLGNLPDDLDDYWNVLLASESYADDAEPSARGEAVGSTVGIYDFAAKYSSKGINAMVYRQFYLETGAGAKFRNAWDGLWGVSMGWDSKFELINAFSWEHLYTKRQSSQEHRGDPPFGADSYYNNSTYRSGWTYHGRTIGNPLLFSDGINRGVINNVVIAHQVAIGGRIGKVSYKAKGIYSRNYGARYRGITARKDQYSFLLATNMSLKKNIDIKVNLAYDTGDLYDQQIGGQIGILYRLE